MSKKIKVDFNLNNVLMFQTILSGDLLNENKEDNIIRIPKKVLNKRKKNSDFEIEISVNF